MTSHIRLAAASAALLPTLAGADAGVTVRAAFPRAAYLALAPGSVRPAGQHGGKQPQGQAAHDEDDEDPQHGVRDR